MRSGVLHPVPPAALSPCTSLSRVQMYDSVHYQMAVPESF